MFFEISLLSYNRVDCIFFFKLINKIVGKISNFIKKYDRMLKSKFENMKIQKIANPKLIKINKKIYFPKNKFISMWAKFEK